MSTQSNQQDNPKGIAVALLFLFFFFVIAAFWTLKPLRTSAVVKTFGIEYYPLLKQGIVVAIPIIVSVYSLLACRLNRARLVYFFAGLFFLSNLVFWVLLRDGPSAWAQLAFYFHVDAYITVMVTLFWTYLNDLYKEHGARKIYGLVGTGGLTGGVLGTLVSGWASESLGTDIILVSAAFMLPIFLVINLLERGGVPRAVGPAAGSRNCSNTGATKNNFAQMSEGMKLVLGSKYLLSIVVIVGVYEVVSTIVDFQFTNIASAAFPTRDSMAGFQGKVFFVGQVASIGVQLFVTTFIHRKYGAVHGLLFLPLALTIGAAAFLVSPVLAVISVTIGSEAAFGYSINQASKEILYVPLDSATKYKGKAFIDMFVLRAAKTVGAMILLLYVFGLQTMGIGSWFLSGVVVVGVIAWLMAVSYVGTVARERTTVQRR